jgi:hypothetical protein
MMTDRDHLSPNRQRLILLGDLRALFGVETDGRLLEELYALGYVSDGAMGIEDVADQDLLRAKNALGKAEKLKSGNVETGEGR